jgi:hydroxypyruvate isomerase
MAKVDRMKRRSFLPLAAGAVVAFAAQDSANPPAKRKGRLKQGVTAGVFRGKQMSMDDMCREAAKLGIYGFDLVKPEQWPILKKYGLVPTMLPPPFGGTIPDGINQTENHDRIEKTFRQPARYG